MKDKGKKPIYTTNIAEKPIVIDCNRKEIKGGQVAKLITQAMF